MVTAGSRALPRSGWIRGVGDLAAATLSVLVSQDGIRGVGDLAEQTPDAAAAAAAWWPGQVDVGPRPALPVNVFIRHTSLSTLVPGDCHSRGECTASGPCARGDRAREGRLAPLRGGTVVSRVHMFVTKYGPSPWHL